MMLSRAWPAVTLVALASLVSPLEGAPPAANGAPRIIVFGGGWGSEGTQASMEAQVHALARVFDQRAALILFASGDNGVRDVQISRELDETSELLGLVFDRLDNLDVSYRASTLRGRKAATKSAFLEVLHEAANDAHGTIVFGVGHGNPASDNVRATIELWGPEDRVAVDALAKHLDAKRRASPIAFVLGHCHSGAFTELSYVEAAPKGRLAEPTRCVLAAVPPERVAAGCTPDMDDPDANAYMSIIAQAFERKQESDYDGDGRVSLIEAHAYARIHDKTVDVPVSTSEAWIARTLGASAPRPASIQLAKTIESARVADRAVINALKPADVSRDVPRNAAKEIELLDAKLDELDDDLDQLHDERDRVRRALLDVVLARWPELTNPYHPEARRLLAGDAAEVVGFLRARRETDELRGRDITIRAREAEKLALEKRQVRLVRWLRAVERVAGEEALRKSGQRRAIEALERLITCESMIP